MRIALYVARYLGEDIQTPPSLHYLAGYLIKKNIIEEHDILFAESVDQILAFNPHILGIGAVSQTFSDAVEICKKVKVALPECWTVIGGYHISALPQCLPRVFDFGVIGEGEITLSELVSLRIENLTIDQKLIRNIKGICFYNEAGIVEQTSRRELIEHIDELQPFRRLQKKQEWAYLFTARGCPFKCMYCASQSFWGGYRFHSAEYIVNEINKLVEDFEISSIYFVDDLFIAPRSRLKRIKQLIEEKGLIGKLRFKGFIRVNLVDDELCSLLKEMGFTEVRFGMETASDRLLSLIKDKPFTVKQAEHVIRLCNKYQLPVCASFMFGIPGEEEADIYASRDFLRKHKGRFYIAGFYLMQPVPGSQLWEESLQKGIVSPNFDFSFMDLDMKRKDFDWNRVIYLNDDKIPLKRFKKIICDLYDEFFESPSLTKMKKYLNRIFHKILLKYESFT